MIEVDKILSFLSGDNKLFITLLFFTIVIAVYSTFIYYFYVFLSRKNLIDLNLSQYNNYEHPALVKFFAILFYITEYIVVLPIITFFWFAVFSVLILFLAKGLEISTILLVSAAMVSSVRVTSYISKSLSQDLGKMLPFTLLAIAITEPGFFDISSLLSRINEIPNLLSNVLFYLIFIMILEVIMRLFDIFRNISGDKKDTIEEGYSAEKVNNNPNE